MSTKESAPSPNTKDAAETMSMIAEHTPPAAADATETPTEAALKDLKNAEQIVENAETKQERVPHWPKANKDESANGSAAAKAPAASDEKSPAKSAAAAPSTEKEDESTTPQAENDANEEEKPKRKRLVAGKTVGSAKKKKKVAAKTTLQGNKSTGGWSGYQVLAREDVTPKAESAPKKDKKKEKKKASSRAKPKESSLATPSPGSRPPPKEIFSGAPNEAIEGGWPDGWTKKTFMRMSGKSQGTTDSYWYSPIEKKKFRSMNEVKRFIAALQQANGDENKAWNLFRGKAS